MAKNKRRGPKDDGRVKTPADLKKPPSAAKLSRRGGRETMDALVVAFVLAFLIRTYVAEAFVIPTGSMAPTLMGQHKDVFCDQCGTRFKVNSSDPNPKLVRDFAKNNRITLKQARDYYTTVAGTCPQCRHSMLLNDKLTASLKPSLAREVAQTANYSGDRLVVSKYAYSFNDPQRWDIAVFKYPGDSQVNYIKRITGLPGEELRIFEGDLFNRPLDSGKDFTIVRKPSEQVMAMRQFVHDTDHEPAEMLDAGWPLRWVGDGWSVEKKPGVATRGASVYRVGHKGESPAGETRWLRYSHLPPTPAAWRYVLAEGKSITATPQPSLITDFIPYNSNVILGQAAQGGLRSGNRFGMHWVSDLMIEADFTVESGGKVSLDLVEGGDHYGVTIDAETGEATFWKQGFEQERQETLGVAATRLRRDTSHQARLANIDNRLLLWIDGVLVEVDGDLDTYQSSAGEKALVPRTSPTDAGDLSPAGIGISGGQVSVKRLRIWRDGYYLAVSHTTSQGSDLDQASFERDDQRNWRGAMQALPSNPELWYAFANRRFVDFRIEEGQLFVMGDNSAQSLDARLWTGGNGEEANHPGGPYLERSQLVGKAICVYWPHAWYSMPGTGRRLPIWPNFGDMRLVR